MHALRQSATITLFHPGPTPGRYARVIIAERGVPPAARTVKPLTSVLGGKAGGEKFLAMGILFKCVPRP